MLDNWFISTIVDIYNPPQNTCYKVVKRNKLGVPMESLIAFVQISSATDRSLYLEGKLNPDGDWCLQLILRFSQNFVMF